MQAVPAVEGIKLSDEAASTGAPAPMSVTKKPGRAFRHANTGKFLAESGNNNNYNDNDNVIMITVIIKIYWQGAHVTLDRLPPSHLLVIFSEALLKTSLESKQ